MSKAEILGNIRRGLKRSAPTSDQLARVHERLTNHPRNLIPQRAQRPHPEQVALFVRMASEAAAEVHQLASLQEVPDVCAAWLAKHTLHQLVTATSPDIAALDWSAHPQIERHTRVAQVGDQASLTSCFAGIAETGTLMLYSQPDSPTTLNFLPDAHFVVLNQRDIVGPYEDAWQKLRQHSGSTLPRSVNMITGPSRSADIEQKLQMGAHGPKDLIILLIDQ